MSLNSKSWDVVVVGGGAAGYMAAITCAESNPSLRITLLERSSRTLAKVKISGGGRCNVTHACFDPAKLVTYYPRGSQALRGPFTRFGPRETVDWFESRGVPLKTEDDGRMFPATDSSQTIMDALMDAARKAGVVVTTNVLLDHVKRGTNGFSLVLHSGESLEAKRLILATGSNPIGWEWANALGHHLEAPVPSLFTFAITDKRLEGLAGLSVPTARLRVEGTKLDQEGALLVTHWGLSGPAVLKLSAWGARFFHDRDYQATLQVNWLPADKYKDGELLRRLHDLRDRQKLKKAPGDFSFGLPRRLWVRLSAICGVLANKRWSEVSNESLKKLAGEIQDGRYAITGKSTFKDEFVTCGGVRLDEVDFRTMESKRCPGLYFAGEILDIDAVTGGFNFQGAWTTGYLAGASAAQAIALT